METRERGIHFSYQASYYPQRLLGRRSREGGEARAGIEVGEFGETCNPEDKSTGESLSDEGDDLESEDTGIEQEEERQHEAEENAEREAKEMQRVERRRMRRVELS